MLGLRIQVQLHFTNVGPPIGKEHHALVHLHPLAFQKLEETALWLFIIRLDEPEAAARFHSQRFDLRHSTVVIISALIAYWTASMASERFKQWQTLGVIVSTCVSACFLFRDRALEPGDNARHVPDAPEDAARIRL